MTSINLNSYIQKLKSSAPTPGGGSCSCVAGALGCAQLHMICELALARPKLKVSTRKEVSKLKAQIETREEAFYQAAKDDERAYTKVANALKLPKETDADKATRTEALQHALTEAATFAQSTIEMACDAFDHAHALSQAPWAKPAISDVWVAGALFAATAEGAYATVLANTHYLANKTQAEHYNKLACVTCKLAQALADKLYWVIHKELA